MNFSTASIRRPVPAILLFVLLTVAGLLGFRALPVQDMPDIEFPSIQVLTFLPGASPSQLETEVARKIESALASIPDIRHVYSTVSDGQVQTNIEFRLEKDASEALTEVRDAVGSVRSQMPTEVREPVLSKSTTAGEPILTFTVASKTMTEEALSWFIDDRVSKALVGVKGVGRVTRVGGLDREIAVELDPLRLAALNVTAADVSRRLRQVQQESPGGHAELGGGRQTLRTVSTARSAADIAALELALPDGRRIRLGQVASVADTTADRNAITLLDGLPVVGLEVRRSKGASEVAVARAVRLAVAELQSREPQVSIRETFNTTDAVEESYRGSMSLLIEGAVLAVLVVWVFLRNARATLISAAALPLSVIPTFAVMHWAGFTLNGVTLLSLALVVGILVDDAIVEIENIERHLRMGKTPMQAALEAADEIGLAVIATTFALVAVFLPTAFMDGVVGKYFRQFGWTASVAVLASLVVARLLTPMMAAYLLKPRAMSSEQPTEAAPQSRVMARYLQAVRWCLRHRGATMAGVVVFFVGAFAIVPLLPTSFMPPKDRAQTQVELALPPGTTLAQTQATAEQARLLLLPDPNVLQVFSAIGGDDARFATLGVKLKPRTERKLSQSDIERTLRERLNALPGARVNVGGGVGEKFALLLTGDDSVLLASAAQAIQRDIRSIPGLGNIASSVSLVRPEIVVTPDIARAADLGVTTAAISETLRVATAGDYDQALAKLNLPQRQVPVRVRLAGSARTDLAVLERLQVPGKAGNVTLSSVATLRLSSGPARIDRLDRSRRVVIHVELNGRSLGDVAKRVNAFDSVQHLPAGVRRGAFGDAELMPDLFAGFALAMSTGVLCVYMVLVLLFRGFMQPVTILVALPLSLGGAFLALLLTGNALSMPSLIGLLMLMGIAAKNSVLLVEYVLVAQRDRGLERRAAILEACHLRARPIVMTTLAMCAGMLPIAIGLGPDPAFRGPMAITVIGGLVTSTLLSLLVVPVVFTCVDDLLRRLRRRPKAEALAQAQARSGPDRSASPSHSALPNPSPSSFSNLFPGEFPSALTGLPARPELRA